MSAVLPARRRRAMGRAWVRTRDSGSWLSGLGWLALAGRVAVRRAWRLESRPRARRADPIEPPFADTEATWHAS